MACFWFRCGRVFWNFFDFWGWEGDFLVSTPQGRFFFIYKKNPPPTPGGRGGLLLFDFGFFWELRGKDDRGVRVFWESVSLTRHSEFKKSFLSTFFSPGGGGGVINWVGMSAILPKGTEMRFLKTAMTPPNKLKNQEQKRKKKKKDQLKETAADMLDSSKSRNLRTNALPNPCHVLL